MDWDKQKPIDESLMGIFRLGDLAQPAMLNYFNSEIGPKMDPPLILIEPLSATRDKLLLDYKISGTPDWTVCIKGTPNIPIGIWDLKTCSPNLFPRYTDLASLRRHKWSYLYDPQVQLYNFADNYEMGAILFVSKNNMFHDWKLIEVPVDFEYVEGVLQKCARVNKAIDTEKPPKKINQPFWCNGCQFEAICLPDLEATGSGVSINQIKEIDDLADRICKLAPYAKEHKECKDSLKGKLVKGQDLVTKTAIIQWKKQIVNMPAKAAYSFEKHYPVVTYAGD